MIAIFSLFLAPALAIGPKCTDCSCNGWDGSNYSNCRLVTAARPCSRYCVKCKSDGTTPMPGDWTKMGDKCKDYENTPETSEETTVSPFAAITSGTCEDVDMDSIESDDDCERALAAMDKSASWEKQTSSKSMYSGCFTATKSGKSYFVYDAPSSKYKMSDPASTVQTKGTMQRKSASADFTYYCHKEEEADEPKTCAAMCEGKCGQRFGREMCGVKAQGSNGKCKCYDGSSNAEAYSEEENTVGTANGDSKTAARQHLRAYSEEENTVGTANGDSKTAARQHLREAQAYSKSSLSETSNVLNIFAAIGVAVVCYGSFRYYVK